MKKVLSIVGLSFTLFSCNSQKGMEDENLRVLKDTLGITLEEQHRPQLHFTPPVGWMNDPNGMVYHEGEYHLFYQHYPEEPIWGPMHWGHAISKDLVHWEHMPVGLYPDELGGIFSGSAVIDYNNTSGFGTLDNPPMIAIYTSAGEEQTQSIAYSLDNGRSWTKYEGNPVLPNPGIPDFRDPKVMWFEEGQKWVMSLAVDDRISFYSSNDLKTWEHESDFGQGIGGHGGVWECPDLIRMEVDDTGVERWVLLVSINPGGPNGGSATQYFVGDFDGQEFVIDDEFEQDLEVEKYLPAGRAFMNFEGATYGNWTAEGTAFGDGPANGTLPNQQSVSGYSGESLVNSFNNGDATTGVLLSPRFTINENFINFKIGGGRHPETLRFELLVDGKTIVQATGHNSETLRWKAWNVEQYKGREAQLRIVDEEKEGWGHILLDEIHFTDEPAFEAQEGIWLDYGRDNYAGVTWSNVPEQDGRHLFIGWMSNWFYASDVPTETWRSASTTVRTLELEDVDGKLRVISKPIEEYEKLMQKEVTIPAQVVSGDLDIPTDIATFDLQLDLEQKNESESFHFELSNTKGQKVVIGYDGKRNDYFIDRSESGNLDFSDSFSGIAYAPRIVDGSEFELRLVVDVASAELFADEGKTVMTDIFFPDEVFTDIKLVSEEGELELISGKILELRSIYLQE